MFLWSLVSLMLDSFYILLIHPSILSDSLSLLFIFSKHLQSGASATAMVLTVTENLYPYWPMKF